LALQTPGEAVETFRKLIGDTDPKESAIGTIRNLYGTDVAHNAIHGADSPENAKKEILFFFPELNPYLD
jgi:nucleoside-diphosphate kinase